MDMNSDTESIISVDLDPDPDAEDNDNGNISYNASSDDVTENDLFNDLELVENLSDEEPETNSDSEEIVNDIVDNDDDDDNGNYDLCADIDN